MFQTLLRVEIGVVPSSRENHAGKILSYLTSCDVRSHTLIHDLERGDSTILTSKVFLMNIIGFTLVAIAVAIGFKKAQSADDSNELVILPVPFVLAVMLGTVGAYLSGFSAYVAFVGVVAFSASLLRFGSDDVVAQIRKGGLIVGLSGLLAIVGGLFANPWQGDITNEDRTDWTPTPVADDATASELLSLDWSSKDENADWPVARLMLELCKIAYLNPVDARAELEKLGFESESISSGSMNGYVASLGDNAVVLLRGTESQVYDVVQDLRFLKSTNDDGSMHGGFVNGYEGMHGQVQKLLCKYKPKKVWITGHSLGGALSIVCARNILEDAEFKIAGVMTFGQTKVVRDDMRSFLEPKLDGKYVFFVNDMDPVTRVVAP